MSIRERPPSSWLERFGTSQQRTRRNSQSLDG